MDIHIQRRGFVVSWDCCLCPASLQLPPLHLLCPSRPTSSKAICWKNPLPWSSISFTASSLLGQASSTLWTLFFFNLLIVYFIWLCQVLATAWGLHCSTTCGILVPWPGIKPASPALEGGFLTTRPPGKSQDTFFLLPWVFIACGFLLLQRTGGLLFTAVHRVITVACLITEHGL